MRKTARSGRATLEKGGPYQSRYYRGCGNRRREGQRDGRSDS